MEDRVVSNLMVVSPQRQQAVDRLENDEFDLLVLGGGIVGAGVARDAALRGLRVGLIEQHDFASGTSSRSSHLLHGGLRYLAQGFLRLVHEASQEKRVLHRIAPHLAEPLAFIFPTRPGWQWARWKLSVGVKLYDLLCGRRNLGKSSWMGRSKLFEMLPGLRRDGVTGAVRYYDGLTNDSRLVLDTLRSADQAGATLANYVRFIDARREGSRWRCQATCEITGHDMTVSAAQVVNATGPWSDKIPHSHTDLRLTKGVHLVIDRERLPLPDAVVLTEGSRILFAIPWGQRVILGTTDTDYAGPLNAPTTDSNDVRYILDIVNDAFPEADLDENDLISTWAGLRPLVADRNGNPSDISRRHEIAMAEPGWWDVTGGKLTTYRLMAEQTVDRVFGFFGRTSPPCQTARQTLLDSAQTNGYSAILPPAVSEKTVEHYCRNEWVVHLDDLMVRRTYWHHYQPDRKDICRQVAPWVAKALGWDEATMTTELKNHLESMAGGG
ncbi:MAG: glycerol-3-phosphate dehydrogenase/oxidase [Pirellulales bacterium]|nr:glycerol-3-phosphate dehydrogenase/oxidase [Pirellulales bacterium]